MNTIDKINLKAQKQKEALEKARNNLKKIAKEQEIAKDKQIISLTKDFIKNDYKNIDEFITNLKKLNALNGYIIGLSTTKGLEKIYSKDNDNIEIPYQ